MKRCMWLTVILFCLRPSAGPAAEYPGQVLDAARAAEDVRLLRRALEELHPGYQRYTSGEAMGQLCDALEKQAATGMTDVELYREISYLLAKIRCSHTKAEVPPALKAHRESVPSYLPFTFRLFGDRMIVDQSAAEDAELQRGDEILSINDHPVSQIISRVEDYLSVDGWTDHAKRVELEASSELLGDAIDHFWPMLFEWNSAWEIEARQASGNRTSQVLQPITYGQWLQLSTGGESRYADFGPETVRFRLLDSSTAYLAIDTFVNYRQPVDPARLFAPHFVAIRDAKIEHLILDLRQCGGGSDDVPQALATFLAPGPLELAARPSLVRTYRVGDLREHLHTWDNSIWNLPEELFRDTGDGFYEFRPPNFQESIKIMPRAENFTGRLTILSSAQNSSGATNFIALLRNKRDDVKIVGEPTGGSVEGTTAGLIYFLKLPNSGITVRIPAMRNFNGIEPSRPGLGVSPDVYVMPDRTDFLDGKDPVLAVALK